MKTLKLYFIIIFSNALFAQQQYHFNQYVFNDLILNPAIAGTGPCKVIGLDIRKQWVGFAGSPSTQNIYFHGGFHKKMGLGVIVFNDVAGAIKMTGIEIDFAYHLIKNKNQLLSFGISNTLINSTIDQSGFMPETKDDKTLTTIGPSKITDDVAAGVFYKNKYFLVSLSAKQILQSNFDVDYSGKNKFIRHYFFSASYNVIVSKKIRIEPSVFIRSIGKPAPQLDFTSKFLFHDMYWLGAGYRLRDAVIVFAGIELGQFTVGYGYEYSVSQLRKFNSGTHEVFLKFNFCKKSKGNLFETKEIKRTSKSVYCPVW